MRDARTETALWTGTVYLLSFLCYTPMLFQRLGYPVPAALLSLKYGFVLVPALVSLLFRVRRGPAEKRPALSRISWRELAVCGAAAAAGLLVTAGYSAAAGISLYGSAYPTAASFAGSCAYLFLTALAEEAAWRGFLFRRMTGNVLGASLGTGIAWAVWHIPMWAIRNALGPAEILPLFLWAVLLSVVLGVFYRTFGHIASAALLHMTFNVCFLAPAALNDLVLLLGVLAGWGIRKISAGKLRKPP